jgi:phosphatidylglycerol:prolipoprotein diacylglycerol transferase
MIPFPEGIQPDIFTINLGGFKFTLYWYALAYVVGIIAWWKIAAVALKKNYLWPNNVTPLNPTKLEDLVTYLVLGIILGGRLGYVIFYHPSYYFKNPMEILFVWQGGMSFHGGLLGVSLAGFIFFWRNSVAIRSGADLLALGSPVGLFLGRLANFINDELWGRVTDVPWGIIVKSPEASKVCDELLSPCVRHASQIYEAILEGLILFVILIYLAFKKEMLKHPGFIAGIFFIGYGLSRCFVELFRQPDEQFQTPGNPLGFFIQIGDYGLTMGQMLSFPMVILGLLMCLTSMRNRTV